MYSVFVDFSVFSATASFGRVSGTIAVGVIPQVGDRISFPLSQDNQGLLNSDPQIECVTRHFLITDRIIVANSPDVSVMLSLDDLVVNNSYDAQAVVKYFERSHGLIGDLFDD